MLEPDDLQLSLPTNVSQMPWSLILTEHVKYLLHRQCCFLTLFTSLASFKPHSLSNAVIAKKLFT